MRTTLLRGAENAMRERVNLLHNRYHDVCARYCAHRGGHDWTQWQSGHRDSVAGGFIHTRHRWCLRCLTHENEDAE